MRVYLIGLALNYQTFEPLPDFFGPPSSKVAPEFPSAGILTAEASTTAETVHILQYRPTLDSKVVPCRKQATSRHTRCQNSHFDY